MQQHPPSLQHSPHFFNWSQQPLAQLLQSSPNLLQCIQNGAYKHSSLILLHASEQQQQQQQTINDPANIEPIITPAKTPEPCSHWKYEISLLSP